ncbi:MAG: hypothetical protein V1709_07760 [Planctomycetota bacterium]
MMILKRHLFILLFWLLLTCIILILFAYETPLFSFLGLNELTLVIEELKLFFISIIFPLVLCSSQTEKHLHPVRKNTNRDKDISGSLDHNTELSNGAGRIAQPSPSRWAGSTGTILYFITFILLSLPLTLLTSYFSGVGFDILLRSNLLLLLIVLFLISLYSKSLPTAFSRYISFYYLIFFSIVGIMPVLYYLILEFTKQSWWILIAINPFWLFWQIKQPDVFYSTWLLQCLIWVGMIILIVLVNILPRRHPNGINSDTKNKLVFLLCVLVSWWLI